MRRALLEVLLHPLTWLCAALVRNYHRHTRDKSTICTVTRRWVPWPLFMAGLVAFLAWFVPHWLRPILTRKKQ